MSEVMREPHISHDKDGNELVTFDADHSLADIARWLMKNRGEAEDLQGLLGQMLAGTYGETLQ